MIFPSWFASRHPQIPVASAGAAQAPPHSHLKVGDKAPDFELPSTQGGRLKLSSFQGKKTVLIEFYVLDFSPT